MAWSYPLSRIQIPWRSLIRPMLLASVAIHAALLLAPFPSEKKEQPKPQEKEDAITLTQVPPKGKSSPTKAKPKPQIKRATPPRLAIKPALPTRPAVVLAPTQPLPSPSPVEEEAPPPAAADPMAEEFPQYPGAQPGSFDLPPAYTPFSQKTSDPVAQVSTWFQQQLSAQGFLPQPVDQAGRTVYQVSKAGKTQFLTLIPNGQGAGTNIILSPQLLPADLGGGGRVVSPEEQIFYQDLAGVIQDANPTSQWQDLDNPGVLPDPGAFYANIVSEQDYLAGGVSTLQNGIERKVLHVGQTPEELFTEISNALQIAEIQVTPKGDYGGGSLYQLSRDGVTRFLSLVPTTDGNTAIFIWSGSPI